MDKKNAIPFFYKRLLKLYPRRFRERLGESMEQTFHDLYREWEGQSGRGFFLLGIFTETILGIVREHVFILVQGDTVKSILANPTAAAIVGFVLALPIGLLRLILGSDAEPLVAPIEALLAVDGVPTAFGYTVIGGGMLLLPVAFAINLQPMLKREGSEGRRRVHGFNLIVGIVIVLLIAVTWGGLFLEEISCLRGIRCD